MRSATSFGFAGRPSGIPPVTTARRVARSRSNSWRDLQLSDFPALEAEEISRSTGLSGKLPVNRLMTMYQPSLCSTAKGAPVYAYLADAAVFQALMASGPQ